jgi:predicted transcriptional regulator
LFIAFFVWIGASQEAGATQMRNAISGIPVGRAMLTDYKSLSPRDPLSRMAQLLLAGSQHDFPVIDEDRVIGVVTRDDFLNALTRHGQNIAVSAVMKQNLPEVDSYEMVEHALMRIQESGVPALPVTHAGRLVGIITAENITEYLMIRSAIRSSSGVIFPS